MEIDTFWTHGLLVMGFLCLDFNMNREDIIRMAQEAGFDDFAIGVRQELLERFATLVAFAERSACAKICVDESLRLKKIAFEHENLQANSAAIRASILAEMIRARGQA